MKKLLGLILASLIFLGFTNRVIAEEAMKDEKNVYSFTMNDIDGKPVDLSQYKGKTLLIVNVASKCGFTPQYKSLETLYEKYKDRGLVILGFPANNFLGQEPGSDEEIKKFCSFKYNVTFPMFSKISVAGNDMHPLYQYLTSLPTLKGPITWNFNKFLVNPKGEVLAHYASKVDPMSEQLTADIEKALP